MAAKQKHSAFWHSEGNFDASRQASMLLVRRENSLESDF